MKLNWDKKPQVIDQLKVKIEADEHKVLHGACKDKLDMILFFLPK